MASPDLPWCDHNRTQLELEHKDDMGLTTAGGNEHVETTMIFQFCLYWLNIRLSRPKGLSGPALPDYRLRCIRPDSFLFLLSPPSQYRLSHSPNVLWTSTIPPMGVARFSMSLGMVENHLMWAHPHVITEATSKRSKRLLKGNHFRFEFSRRPYAKRSPQLCPGYRIVSIQSPSVWLFSSCWIVLSVPRSA